MKALLMVVVMWMVVFGTNGDVKNGSIKSSQHESVIPASVKERNNDIIELKKEIKEANAEIKLKGTFKSSANEDRVVTLKKKVKKAEKKINELEAKNQLETQIANNK